ncbi:MAG: DPP IV N-terminal domain-containing protein [Flavobacteriales bacterium]|nr:DPP IV N-terminal domain-containing protein [Flavobacteriales bacterium]
MILKNIFTAALVALTLSLSAQDITLEDIWKKGTFKQRSVYGLSSMNDGIHYTTLDRGEEGNEINKYSYATGEKLATILSDQELQELTDATDATINGYRFSTHERFALIPFDQESIYRHSTEEHYYIVDLKERKARQLASGEKQRHATLSPDGKSIAYVQENNIYIQDYATGSTTQITKDGEHNKIINGFADWVYEEEFAFDQAFFWSPDGKKIAYYRFDETDVKEFHMPVFDALYPEDYTFKYPKAGEDNSKVTIHVYDVSSASTNVLDIGDYEYIPRIKWTQDANLLAVMKMPRLQNVLEIDLVNTSDFSRKMVYKEASDTYIEISDDLTFYGNNAGFIWRSEKDGFFHLYSYDIDGGNGKQITNGDWEVKQFIGFDPQTETLYFSASKTAVYNTEIYSVSLKGGEPQLLSPKNGTSRASFSAGYQYFILYHGDANTPQTVTLKNASGKDIRTLEDNAELKETLKGYNLPSQEFFEMTTSEGVKLNGWMIKPNDFDKKKKYPVLMYVYGGPGSQTVSNAMGGNSFWYHMMAQKGYIIVSIDNRGTGARGKDFRTLTYRQLGKYETMDQIEAAKWLASQSYVDGSRIGIWGWSYGGYMSSLCLFKGAEQFKTAVAVAPVSNWRYYDNIYTERYMGLPQDNADGYDQNSPINHTDKMKGNYLLIHGTADDNVHFQNAVEMVDALIESDKQFDFYIYPDRNHGIYGGNARYHLFTKITNFLTENL